MSTKWQLMGVSLVSLTIGVVGGAVAATWLLLRTGANPADRLAFELGTSAAFVATHDGAPIDDAARLGYALSKVQQDTQALGLMFDQIMSPQARDAALRALKRIDANPLVRADTNRAAQFARECLLEQAAKPEPDYASCREKLREMTKGYAVAG